MKKSEMKNKLKNIEDWAKMWNQHYMGWIQLRKNSDQINTLAADFLEELILEAKQNYYNGTPQWDDWTYDCMEEKLRILRPDSKVLEMVGSNVNKKY